MGALHLGHTSLVDKAKTYADYTIVSIFINPKQFNNNDDLINYPVSIEKDLELLKEHNCDAVFIPKAEEIYQDKYVKYTLDLGEIGEVLEAKNRPGHFEGVVEVLHLLFNLVQPNYVFFGLKDYQQVLVVEKLLGEMNSDIELIKCRTVRGEGGLALSSRNKRLSEEERSLASNLYKTLSEIKESYGKADVSILKLSYLEKLNQLENTKVEYIDIVDYQSLKSLKEWNPKGENLAILAVYIGEVRLIDNLLF